MQTLIQKVHVDDGQSFACRYYRTPYFETNWHRHEEYELILITEGQGTLMLGDYVGTYAIGDIYFISSNIPHWFRKNNPNDTGEALVLQFDRKVFGDDFLQLPENRSMAKLLAAENGIQLNNDIKQVVREGLTLVPFLQGWERLLMLLTLLDKMGRSNEITVLTNNFTTTTDVANATIEKIIAYSFQNYLGVVKVNDVADLVNMSVPTFSRFFKKNIKKTYMEFLQSLRIAHACKLLTSTDRKVLDVCYESGFNSWAHFSKQFRLVKKMTPLQYRKEFH